MFDAGKDLLTFSQTLTSSEETTDFVQVGNDEEKKTHTASEGPKNKSSGIFQHFIWMLASYF